jgi:hypothetical protein
MGVAHRGSHELERAQDVAFSGRIRPIERNSREQCLTQAVGADEAWVVFVPEGPRDHGEHLFVT